MTPEQRLREIAKLATTRLVGKILFAEGGELLPLPVKDHQIHSLYLNHDCERDSRKGRYWHNGIDIPCVFETAVWASAASKVVDVRDSGAWGLRVYLQITSGKYSGLFIGYCHLMQACVEPGDEIGAGTIIGYSGYSGSPNSKSYHLHVMCTRQTDAAGKPVFWSGAYDFHNNTGVNPAIVFDVQAYHDYVYG